METLTKKYLQLEDLEVYNRSFDLSNKVWDLVVEWNYLAQNTVGSQLVRSIDSVSANVAEGFGRFGKKDKIKFYRISRASVLESKDWLNKSVARKLITKETHSEIITELEKLPKLLNGLIKITNDKLKL
ncbi:MAG TPA: four helix bundle protein [Bacteroidia bacterium]|jgi:four helix bundle protein|nr:four helix bundle protein [Bacteroidia bacterium]